MGDAVKRALLVDDSEDEFIILRSVLSNIENNNIELTWIPDYDKALEEMCGNRFDIYLLDFRLGVHTGIELIENAFRKGCSGPVILLTSFGNREIDIQAMKAGAIDFINKNELNETNLERSIRYAIERNSIEKMLKKALKEKEILLREVNHRIKNNMQIIISILEMQKKYLNDKNDMAIFQDIVGRIRSMSIIHELLYQTKDFTLINFAEYIKKLLDHLIISHRIDFSKINIIKEVDPLDISMDKANYLGFIINELISNSMKYAFSNKEKGILKIMIKNNNGKTLIEISDNGDGLPEGFDIKNSKSLGMKLVYSMVDQLNAKIRHEQNDGLHWYIDVEL